MADTKRKILEIVRKRLQAAIPLAGRAGLTSLKQRLTMALRETEAQLARESEEQPSANGRSLPR
jgi:hypothetical protein